MNGSAIHHDQRQLGTGTAKSVKAGDYDLTVYAVLKDIGVQVVVGIVETQDIDTGTRGSGQLQRFAFVLPGIRDARVKGKPRFVKVIEIAFIGGGLRAQPS